MPGKEVHSGIKYQALASLALFLQYLKIPEFDHIHLEAPGWADFNLVFNDGRKIICEAKFRTRGVQDYIVREILGKIARTRSVNEGDEILIVCNKYNAKVFEIAKYYKYMPESFNAILDKKGYTEAEKQLIPKLRVWQVEEENLWSIINLLFYELIGFWLPEDDIRRVIDSILIRDVYEGAEKGSTFSREEVKRNIHLLAKEIKKSSTSFNEELRSYEDRIKTIINDVRSGLPKRGHRDISALSLQPDLMFLLLDKLKEKKRIDLTKWDMLWKACLTYMYPYTLFNIFEKNMKSKTNRQYVLDFLLDHYIGFDSFYSDRGLEGAIAKLLEIAIAEEQESYDKALSIIELQILRNKADVFYLEKGRDLIYKIAEISKPLYSLFLRAPDEMKDKIYMFIVNTYNLVEDEGEFTHYTPVIIFEILKLYIGDRENTQFESRFLDLSAHLSNQYDLFYKQFGKRLDFDGWDLMGSGISLFGGKYSATDRQFITRILIPSMEAIEEERRWRFILNHCVTPTKKVNKDRPDFLNRVALPFVLEEYCKGEEIASEILKEYLLSRKGIPNKTELIYQNLLRIDCADDRKWNLLEVTINKFGIPVNPFVEMIVGNLANAGYKDALLQLKKWASETRYYETPIFPERQIVNNIAKLLPSSPKDAIAIFKKFISNKYFKNELENYYIDEVSSIFADIIIANPKMGWKIWDSLNERNRMTSNQQLLLIGTMKNLAGKDNGRYEKEIFSRVFSATENYEEFVKKYRNSYARQQVIDIVEELIKSGLKPTKGLRIIGSMVDDPDPSIRNEPDDPEGEFNYHLKIRKGEFPHIITSVRGKLPWVMQLLIRPGIQPRIHTALELTNRLLNDSNLYVRQQACVALARLAQVRHQKIGRRRFLETRIAGSVEEIAFGMLSDVANEAPAIQERLSHVFNYMRFIGFKKAYRAAQYFAKAHDEARDNYLGTIIYFAEFSRFSEVNKEKFRGILDYLIDTSEKARRKISWHMWTMEKDGETGSKRLDIALKYLWKLVDKYDMETYLNIYRIIKENLDNNFYKDELADIYLACIGNESKFLSTYHDYESRPWAAFHYNGDILNAIYKFNNRIYIEALKILVNYPKECHIGNIKDTIDKLYMMPSEYDEDISNIFENLVQRSAVFYESKEKWRRILRVKEQNKRKTG